MNFEIGNEETRTGRRGDSIKVRVVTFADHVGDVFLVRTNGAWFRACSRCGGYGHYSYNPMDGTRCFGCGGYGLGEATTEEAAVALMKTRIAARARKERTRIAALHAEAIAWNEFWNENADVIEWLASRTDRNGFVGDVARKAGAGTVLSEKQVSAIRRIMKQDAERKAVVNEAGYFGEIGKRETITATVKMIREIETMYGFTTLVIMETEAGHVLKTFSAGAFGHAAEVGETLTFKGTVKEQSEYNDRKETMLSRVALVK